MITMLHILPAHVVIILVSCVSTVFNFNERWDALQSTNQIDGSPCYNPCQKRGSKSYWCRSLSIGWDYCSPPQKDIYGNKCTSDCFEVAEGKRNWCDIQGGSWGYCSRPIPASSKTQLAWSTSYLSPDNSPCISSCTKEGDQFRCTIGYEGFEHKFIDENCSPKPKESTKGNKCQTACTFNENEWKCETGDGVEEDCGVHYISSSSQYTKQAFKCVTPCKTRGDGDNDCFSPNAASWTKTCSLFSGLAVNNDRCTSPCDGRAGDPSQSWQEYNWCWTAKGKYKWNYCSNSTEDPDIYASFISPEAESRVPFRWYLTENKVDLPRVRRLFPKTLYHYKDDTGHNMTTFWRTVDGSVNQFPAAIEDIEWSLARSCLNNWMENKFSLHDTTSNSELAIAKDDKQNSVVLEQLKPAPLKSDDEPNPALYVVLKLNFKSGQGASISSKLVGHVQAPLKAVNSNKRLAMDALFKSVFVRKAIEITQLTYSDALRSLSRKPALDVSIYKVEFNSDVKKLVQEASKRQVTLATREVFNNPSPSTISQVYSKTMTLTETFITEKLQAFTVLHSATVAAGLEFNIPLLNTVKLNPTYKHDRTSSSTTRESETHTRTEAFTITKTLTVPPCTALEAYSYVSVIDQLSLKYQIFMKVQGVQPISTVEIRENLPLGLEYVSDVSENVIIAKTESNVVVKNAGISTEFESKGDKIKNCG